MKTVELLKIIEEVRANNPYPDNIFIEKTHRQWKRLQKALAVKGITPDGYFGSWSRKVWNNCCDKMKKLVEDEVIVKGKQDYVR